MAEMSDAMEVMMQPGELWWHVYGGEVPDFGGYCLATFGESTRPPDDGLKTDIIPRGGGELRWLASFDHEPTEAETDPLKPEEYR